MRTEVCNFPYEQERVMSVVGWRKVQKLLRRCASLNVVEYGQEEVVCVAGQK